MATEQYPAAKIRGTDDPDKFRITLGGTWLCDDKGVPLVMSQAEAERRLKERDFSAPKDGKK